MSVGKVCLILLPVCIQAVVSWDTQSFKDKYDQRLSAIEDLLLQQNVRIQQLIDDNAKLNMENGKLIKKVARLENVVSINRKESMRLLKRISRLGERKPNICTGTLKDEKSTKPSYDDSDRLRDEMKHRKIETDMDGNSDHGKRIITGEPIPREINGKPVVAFYAYMNGVEIHPSQHHILLFDAVKTNKGNAYNSFSGYFTVPVAGIYAFSYSVRAFSYKHIFVQLVKNAEVEGAISADSSDVSNNDSATQTLVIEVNSGDVVFVRPHATVGPGGGILSEGVGRSYFAGWLIG